MKLEKIVEPLLKWYTINKRSLPWRKDQDPYHVWISEIMLQQTRVEAVKNYYTRFIKELPSILELANVPEDKLLKLWEGLGYYTRARNLKKAAQIIQEQYNGIFPDNYRTIILLPGIGEYTAGAIASICFKEKVPAVDGNVLRVLSRILNSYKNIDEQKTKKEFINSITTILPNPVGEFNQALMELGALICIPNGMPKCEECPLNRICLSNKEHTQLDLPIKRKKKQRKKEEKTIFIFIYHDKVAIRKREDKGLLAGLYEFPNTNEILNIKQVANYLKKEKIEAIRIFDAEKKKHIFSHVEWYMQGYCIFVEKEFKNKEYEWISYFNLKEEYALPTAFGYFEEELKKRIIHS